MIRTLFFLFLSFPLFSQSIEVEYKKDRDYTIYKTFSFGESEIITPKDQRQVSDASLKALIQKPIKEELMEKGLQPVDSAGDLIATFVAGTQARTDLEQLGPLGMTPGSNAQTWSRDYRMGSMIIDLEDRQKNLIWRINATSFSSSSNSQQMIDEVVSAGFKKLSFKPKKSKKK